MPRKGGGVANGGNGFGIYCFNSASLVSAGMEWSVTLGGTDYSPKWSTISEKHMRAITPAALGCFLSYVKDLEAMTPAQVKSYQLLLQLKSGVQLSVRH